MCKLDEHASNMNTYDLFLALNDDNIKHQNFIRLDK